MLPDDKDTNQQGSQSQESAQTSQQSQESADERRGSHLNNITDEKALRELNQALKDFTDKLKEGNKPDK